MIANMALKLFSFAPLRFMGMIAYGVYLFHSLIQFLCREALLHFRVQSGTLFLWVADSVRALSSVALAGVSWKYFEKPLVDRGHRNSYAARAVENCVEVENPAVGSAKGLT